MRKFNITVSGKTYEVLVEEVGAASAPVAAAPVAPVAAAPANGTTVSAPMPGTILDVKVTNGQAVKEGDVLCVLEAMKMENDIQAPCDGTVVAIQATKGSSVETGAPLVTIG